MEAAGDRVSGALECLRSNEDLRDSAHFLDVRTLTFNDE